MYELIEVKTLNKKKVIITILVVLAMILLIVLLKTHFFGLMDSKGIVKRRKIPLHR